MQHVFSDYTQGERSPFIREMWEKEIHKPTWSLIGKVFTHIRDFSGGFNSTLQYAVAAIEETGLTQPDRWLNTYNMVLVIDNAGAITLRQHTPPTSIPEPRQLTDVELLFQVLKRGLPVKNPVELLDSLVRSQKHYMTVSDPAAPTGKSDTGYRNAANDDPFAAMSYLLGLAPTHSEFERGVGNIETLGTTRVDSSLLANPGEDTFGGLDFDESTAHLSVLNNGALNVNTMTTSLQAFEMGVPPQWDGFSGQISQHAHQIGQFSTFFCVHHANKILQPPTRTQVRQTTTPSRKISIHNGPVGTSSEYCEPLKDRSAMGEREYLGSTSAASIGPRQWQVWTVVIRRGKQSPGCGTFRMHQHHRPPSLNQNNIQKNTKKKKGHKDIDVEGLDSGCLGHQNGTQDVEHSDCIHTSGQPRRESTFGQKRRAFSGGLGGSGQWSSRAAHVARAWNTRTSLID